MSFRTLAPLFALASLVAACGANLPSTNDAQVQDLPTPGCSKLVVTRLPGENGPGVNLRETPNGTILRNIPWGSTVNFIRDFQNGWYLVVAQDGLSGYMWGQYLKPGRCQSTPPTPAPNPQQLRNPAVVAACYGEGNPSSGRPLFQLVHGYDAQGAPALQGRGQNGDTLDAQIIRSRTSSDEWRNIETTTFGEYRRNGNQISALSQITFEMPKASVTGKLSLLIDGSVRAFKGCSFSNMPRIFSRAGDFTLAQCRDVMGRLNAELMLRLDADGRIVGVTGSEGLGARPFTSSVASRFQSVESALISHTLNLQNTTPAVGPNRISVTFAPNAMKTDLTFGYVGAEETFNGCDLFNSFLLDDAF